MQGAKVKECIGLKWRLGIKVELEALVEALWRAAVELSVLKRVDQEEAGAKN